MMVAQSVELINGLHIQFSRFRWGLLRSFWLFPFRPTSIYYKYTTKVSRVLEKFFLRLKLSLFSKWMRRLRTYAAISFARAFH